MKSDEHLIPESRTDKAVPSLIKTGPDDEFSGSTREIRELQAALRAAQMTTTGTGSRYSGIDGDKMWKYDYDRNTSTPFAAHNSWWRPEKYSSVTIKETHTKENDDL